VSDNIPFRMVSQDALSPVFFNFVLECYYVGRHKEVETECDTLASINVNDDDLLRGNITLSRQREREREREINK
jgi:hypothetical protein